MTLQLLNDQAWLASVADEDAVTAFTAPVQYGNPSRLVDVVQTRIAFV